MLGIDPGLANTGWGLVRKDAGTQTCLAYGCISTSKNEPLEYRLKHIYDQILQVCNQYKPAYCGVETVWFGSNVSAGILTSQARGAVLVALAIFGIKVFEYSPKQIKLTIAGVGSADKKQIQYMVQKMLNLKCAPSPDHAADALAAALCVLSHER